MKTPPNPDYTEAQRSLASRLQHLFNSGHPKHTEAEALRLIAEHDKPVSVCPNRSVRPKSYRMTLPEAMERAADLRATDQLEYIEEMVVVLADEVIRLLRQMAKGAIA